MTLAEKLDYIGGYNDFYVRPIPRLGVPALKMADGPAGVRNYGDSTAYPTGIALASTWNPALVEEVGVSMGQDARARGVHFLLAPAVNIYRAPMCGRNFEYFGEDPFLSSRMAVAAVKGIQSQGVIATVKHFAGNNQEWDRHHVSSDIDDRTLHEIYLPAFESAVKEGHAGAIMDSYNPLNGVHMTENEGMNAGIAKKEWGFRGIIMSDWDATYDGIAAANGGLDLEMPSGKFMSRETLLKAVKSGRVQEATIDDKVRRIVRTAIEFGFFDRPQQIDSIPRGNPAAHRVALQAARESIVLLKNNGLLPFDPAKLKRIAVIGPNAGVAITGGGGSSLVHPFEAATVVDAVKKLVGMETTVGYAPGVPVASDSFRQTEFSTTAEGGTPGLVAEYFNNPELKGAPALVRTDQHIVFDWGEGSYISGGPVDDFSARWTGYFTPASSGTYEFAASGDDGFRLYVDDRPIIEQWQYRGEAVTAQELRLVAGKHYKIRLEYFEGTGQAKIGFGISDGAPGALPLAVDAARNADAVILCAGFSSMTEGEGSDRPFDLPKEQVALIQAVLAVNHNVAIVLNAGGAVDVSRWIGSAPALLQAWYGGQEGGTAVAQVLFGVANPSGKLPISWERRWEDNSAFHSYYDRNGSKHVAYTEGVFLGYRHFDRAAVKPLFPFGYGLSYTTFRYGGLKIEPAKATGNQTVQVTFNLTNTGSREGAEAAEVYVAEKRPKVERPVKELKGFAKVSLRPGETRTVTVPLDRRAFSYYDTAAAKWTVNPGDFEILVGSSSQQIEARGSVTITQ